MPFIDLTGNEEPGSIKALSPVTLLLGCSSPQPIKTNNIEKREKIIKFCIVPPESNYQKNSTNNRFTAIEYP